MENFKTSTMKISESMKQSQDEGAPPLFTLYLGVIFQPNIEAY